MKPLHSSGLLGFVILLVVGYAQGQAQDPPAPSPEEHRKALALIEQLADRSFRVREQASQALLKMGLAAKPALLEGTKYPDLEVRRRCELLLPAILSAELKGRIDHFLADTEGKDKHDLPGWERYQQLVGKDAQARQFFIDMLRLNLPLLQAIGDGPEKTSAIFGERCKTIQETLQQPIRGAPPQLNELEIGCLLLISADPKFRMPQEMTYQFPYWFQRSPLREALTKSEASPFRKLFFGWLNIQTDDNVISQMLRTVTSLKLKEGLDLALKVVRDKKGAGRGQGYALTVVGELGGKEHVALLEPFLTDTASVSSFSIGNELRGKTEVRDVALAMLVHLTGQAHKDYQFTYTMGKSHEYLKFNAPFLGFSTDEDRTGAFEKWKAWKAKQK